MGRLPKEIPLKVGGLQVSVNVEEERRIMSRSTMLRMFGTLGCRGGVLGDVRRMTRTSASKFQNLKIPPVVSNQVCETWAH